MLQVKDIETRFKKIDHAIGMAYKACNSAADASPQLVECLTRLNKQSILVKQAVQANDEAKIVKSVDELEMIGDEAERACIKDTHATSSIKDAVGKVHRDLSELKHQLH
jgi:hypothetical protein